MTHPNLRWCIHAAILLILLPSTHQAQVVPAAAAQPIHQVYIVGNAADAKGHPEYIDALSSTIRSTGLKSTVLYTGDLVGKCGLEEGNIVADSLHLLKLIAVQEDNSKTDVHFIMGDRDWDNSGKLGLEKARALEKLVEKNMGYNGLFKPSKGCPGPKHFDFGDHLRVIVINSQWLLHPHEVPQAPLTDCKVLTAEDFWEELEDVIDESSDKNILIAAHHPIYSNGPYGGKKMWKKHLFPLTDLSDNLYIPLPVLGTFYASFRKNVGTPRDMKDEEYTNYIDVFEEMLYDYHPLILATGHAYNMELIFNEKNYHLNAGAAGKTKPSGNSKQRVLQRPGIGFARLSYFADGQVTSQFFRVDQGKAILTADQMLYASACSKVKPEGIPVNESFIPCRERIKSAKTMDPAFRNKTATVIAGEEYAAGKLKSFWLGQHYRDSWTVPVEVPYLDLDNTFGGLTPFELGGGRQTTSLKFNAGNGKEYVFRSVNKNPVKALPHDLRGTIVEDIFKDQTTTQHPYGALVASELMEATDILHAKPKLYLLPDDPKLGQWQYLGNLFGMLEDRPKGPRNGVMGFEGADDVDRSFKMFRKVYGDNDNAIDPQAYARARVFDMLIGDWGRHEDNWKWAGYDNGKGLTYYPIPRDRDHAFSRWDGLFPWIADREWARSNSENFTADFRINGIRSLTWPARHLDRLVGTELSEADWLKTVTYLQERLTDEVIEEAVKALPEEDYTLAGEVLETKLKSRRGQLDVATKQFYKLLAKEVDVVASNKREIFEVDRLNDGDVSVRFYKKKKNTGEKGALKFDRLFKKGETREIRLYGLAGDDDFVLRGTSDKSIMIRVISGEGKDDIQDRSRVSGPKKMTRIYDSKGEDLIMKGNEAKVLRTNEIVRYERKAFKYNSYLPLPILSYSGDDGFGFGAGISWKIQKFQKEGFARKHNLSISGTTRGTLGFRYIGAFRDVIGKADARLSAQLGTPVRDYPDFYGIGNETVKNDSLFRENYYLTNQDRFEIQPSLVWNFLQQSEFLAGLHYEYSNVVVDPVENGMSNRFFQTAGEVEGLGENQFAGAFIGLDLDFRDKKNFTLNGLQLYIEHRSYLNISLGSSRLGKSKAFLAFYQTARIGIPVTFVVKGGVEDTYGEVPYYRLSTLGQRENLRGYFRNRFAGNTAAYFNSEIRLQVAEIPTPLVPVKFGITGFYDLGKVWVDGGPPSDKLHQGYGGGVYFAPYREQFALSLSLAHSEEESILLMIGLGFLLQ